MPFHDQCIMGVEGGVIGQEWDHRRKVGKLCKDLADNVVGRSHCHPWSKPGGPSGVSDGYVWPSLSQLCPWGDRGVGGEFFFLRSHLLLNKSIYYIISFVSLLKHVWVVFCWISLCCVVMWIDHEIQLLYFTNFLETKVHPPTYSLLRGDRWFEIKNPQDWNYSSAVLPIS
jgi:hypothetical protein